MFRITESEKPKFLLGCVVFSTWAKQRRRQQQWRGNATLLRSTCDDNRGHGLHAHFLYCNACDLRANPNGQRFSTKNTA